ncbi:MAG: DNA polymerase III subunit gamma/tau [Firmicutes bacterium]|nr:DNA polymerase III subunit gamma/tau [Bacillota bacterium]
MEYQTLYRRWRPRGFTDFVGQNHVVTTLVNAVEGKRVAHAYLFTGPRGTGKTSIAKILAKALNCENPKGAEPCDQCSNCVRINEGIFLDVLEIDAASNRGIDEIRDLREKIKFAPAEGKYKIYIIDEVHMLTAEAFNALLKTLEEPPEFVVFILATTEVHKIPATILSRCQRFDFKRFTVAEIKGRLEQIVKAEKVEASSEGLELIAKHADGGMRDAVSMLEQALAHGEAKLEEADVRAILGLIDQEEIDHLTSALKERDTKRALELLAGVNLSGKDLWQFGRSLVEHFRQLLLASLSAGQEVGFTTADLVKIIEVLAGATLEVKRSQQSALPLELALIKLTALPAVDQLETRIAKLEALVAGNLTPLETGQTKPLAAPKLNSRSNPAPAPVKPKPDREPAPQPVTPLINDPMKHWEVFLEVIKKKKRTLAALIQEGKPIRFEKEELVVGFPPHLTFHMENVAIPANKELLESILKNICGRDLKISFVLLEKKPDPNKENRAEEPELLKKTVDLFGGEVRPVLKEEN